MTRALALVLAVLPSLAVKAQTPRSPADVLAEYGLTGTWSVACDQPASPHNPRMTYKPRPDGQVDGLGDLGEGGLTLATSRDAFIDDAHRLHLTSYSAFDSLPTAMKESLAKSGLHPNMTVRNVQIMAPDGSLTTDDVVIDLDGNTVHTVSDGHIMTARGPGSKMPVRVKCADAPPSPRSPSNKP